MQELESKIYLLNVTRYADKKTGEAKMILNYIFTNAESIAHYDKFKGAQVQTQFVNNDNSYGELDNFILRESTLKFAMEQNAKNPLKPIISLKGLVSKDGKTINLA